MARVSLDKADSPSPVFTAFRAGLAELGYVEGKNLVIDGWWGDGSIQWLKQQRDALIASPREVIVARGGIALAAMVAPVVDRPVLFSMSAGPVTARIAASYADRVHEGVKPADLPIEQSTRFELVITLMTAKALDRTVPPDVLLQANEVIE